MKSAFRKFFSHATRGGGVHSESAGDHPRNKDGKQLEEKAPTDVTSDLTTNSDDDEGAHGMFIFEDKHENELGNVDIVPSQYMGQLKDMLPTVIPNARIMSFGYDSSVHDDETEAISRDVELVVRSHVNELEVQGLPRNLLSALQKDLIARADQTFLWTTLMIDLLKDATIKGASQTDLEGLLENRDIDAVYAHLLERSIDADRSKKLLKLVLAAARPLPLEELNVAMAVSPQQLSFNDELESNLKHLIENYVKAICGHFVRIIRSEVYLVHQTAREFLLRQQEFKGSPHLSNWHHSVAPGESEIVLLRSWFSYLILTAVAEDENYNATREFLHYSSEFWSRHFNFANCDILDEIVEIGLRRCKRSSRYVSQWSFAHDLILQLDNWRFAIVDAWGFMIQLQPIMAMNRIFDSLILRLLSESEINVKATDALGRTLLHYASAIGSSGLVKTLLDKGADVSAVDSRRNTPLHFAVKDYKKASGGGFRTGNQRMFVYKRRMDPLYSKDIVYSLIAKGANIDAMGEDNETPLHVASKCGFPDVVKLLLFHGANINLKDANLRTILHSAADSGSVSKISTILDRNPGLTQAEDCHGETAFGILKRRPTIGIRLASQLKP